MPIQVYFLLSIFNFLMSILFSCMCVHPVHAWCPWRPEETVGLPELELQMVVNLHVEPQSSGKASSVLLKL